MPSKNVVLFPPPNLQSAAFSVFLDFDGTLVDIVQRPEDVIVDRSLMDCLMLLQDALKHRLAIVSGRSIAQLDSFFGPAAQDFALVGSHGAEMRINKNTHVSATRPKALDDAAVVFAKAFADHPGVVIEVKSFGVAIHYRLEPSMERPATIMAFEFAKENGLELQQGKMVVELKTAGHDKGSAIRTLLSHTPFSGHIPVFVGDDLTDEAGFEACAMMGGFGVLVGPQRESAASYGLDNVAAVRKWLATA